MLHDERGLDEVLLGVFFEEQRQDVASFVLGFDLDAVFLCDLHGLFARIDLVEVHARVLADRFGHRDLRERLAEVDLQVAEGNDVLAVDDLIDVLDDPFRALHHAFDVRVGFVELDGRELRIVAGVHAFVAEDAAHVVDPVQTADDAAL